MTSSNPLPPSLMRKLLWLWEDFGVIILGVVVVVALLATGFSVGLYQAHSMVDKVVQAAKADVDNRIGPLEDEKALLRRNIAAKNTFIEYLTKAAIEAGAKPADINKALTEANKAQTETIKALSDKLNTKE